MKLELEWWLEELECVNIVLLPNSCNFCGIAGKRSVNVKYTENCIAFLLVTKPLEYFSECVSDGVQNFMIVILEGHFQIQADELR
jgi:hypothetical protein